MTIKLFSSVTVWLSNTLLFKEPSFYLKILFESCSTMSSYELYNASVFFQRFWTWNYYVKILHFHHLMTSTQSYLDIPEKKCHLSYEKHEAKCVAFLSHKEEERCGVEGKPRGNHSHNVFRNGFLITWVCYFQIPYPPCIPASSTPYTQGTFMGMEAGNSHSELDAQVIL